jgi:OmpA-OmpF porin, OOP family
MRSSPLLVALALVASGCAAADKRTCTPLLSWSAPAFRCVGEKPPEPEPEPEPEPPPPPEPEPEPERVVVKDEKIEISEIVQFETGSAVLLPESERLLDEVAAAILEHPEITKVQIEGHTDSRAGDAYNMKLSKRRADSVKKYLVGKGVEAKRLSTKGFGETQPVADNETDDGRFRNRRVEFKILERK